MTQALSEIDGAGGLTPDSFVADIVQACRPVVLRGVASDWPAVAASARSAGAFIDYLKGFRSDVAIEAFFGEPQIAGKYYYGGQPDGFNFERRRVRFGAALDAMLVAAETPGAASVYVGSVPTQVCLPGFCADNPMPLLGPEVQPRIWLGNASNISCHYDTLDNLACVVAGRRRFTLYPPELIGDLYVGPIDRTMAGQPVSLAASAAPGDERFPRFEAVKDQAMVVELAPGDALYLPKLWWHQVEGLAPLNGLVNFWWDASSAGPDAPYASLLLAMIAIAERPAGERQAWRAFFDHYVFRPDGHPLAHLPSEEHGLLGPLKANYGRLRARVMQMLRSA